MSNTQKSGKFVEIVRHIPLSKIVRSPFQVRAGTDEDLQALADDMAANGLVQPITVRVVKFGGVQDAADVYELVAGHRRTEAARLLGWETILARIVEADDDAAERMLVAENFARRDLTPIEMADTAAALVERHGAKEAGRICGKSERWAQRMAYIAGRLSPDWRRIAQAWNLSQGSLAALCLGTEETQAEKLQEILDDCACDDVDALNKLRGSATRTVGQLENGGIPADLDPDKYNSRTIENFPWQDCGCGDCNGCKNRSDAVPDFLQDGDSRGRPTCLSKKCRVAKEKEWYGGRGIDEWTKKLGCEVRQKPKHVNYWQGSMEEGAHDTVPVFMGKGDFPAGGVRWFSEGKLEPPKKKGKEKKVWPTDREVRESAYCETVRKLFDEWKAPDGDLMRLAVALCGNDDIDGTREYDYVKRVTLADALSQNAAAAGIKALIASEFRYNGFEIGSGQNGPSGRQLDFWKALAEFIADDDGKLAALKAEADAVADQRIADIAAAKKAEKSAKRKAKK